MKISCLRVRLSESDIIGIVEEYLNVEGLLIKRILIEDILIIFGTYTKGINIPFKIEFGFGRVKNNTIMLKILSVKIAQIGVSASIIGFAIDKIIKNLKEFGVNFKKDNIYLEMDLIAKIIPFVYFKINSISSFRGYIEIEAENIIYAKDKEVEYPEESDEIGKIVDFYTKLRENIKNKIPDKYKQIGEYAMIIPDLIVLLGRLLRDDRVDAKTKAVIAGVIAYLASPIQIISEVIPIVGQVDQLGIIFFLFDRIINEVPEEVILENWQGDEGIIRKIKDGSKFIFNTIGANNTVKILKFISSMKRNKK